MAASSQAQACILRYESRPFSVSLSQGFGLDSSSETVPMLVPNPGEPVRVIIGDKDMDQVLVHTS